MNSFRELEISGSVVVDSLPQTVFRELLKRSLAAIVPLLSDVPGPMEGQVVPVIQ